MKITSRANPKIAALRLLSQAKNRAETNAMLLEGQKLIDEAQSSGAAIHTIVHTNRISGSYLQKFEGAVEIIEVSEQVLLSLCDTATPQGIVACVSSPATSLPESFCGDWLALDSVQDPGNVGAIIRTADAFGFGGVLLNRNCADVFSPKAVRSSMGSVFHIPLAKAQIGDQIKHFRSQGYCVIATHLSGQKRELPPCPKLLLIGNESKGVSEDLAAQADILYKIPMKGKAESLNAAVAASIMIYELSR